ncbi:hypothetical protein ACH5RR_019180 [Cinchona calisaya]|uniref:Uncharacterized protein n=1 Tax=Cinchona calisaya TaxID=153742 RepID=A0ABD2ZNM9_9GENT
MSVEMKYIAGGAEEISSEGGFVKEVVTYMVMDDLEVKPMSTISSIALLNKFNVKALTVLKETDVDLGMNSKELCYAFKLLKASLESKRVLPMSSSIVKRKNKDVPVYQI